MRRRRSLPSARVEDRSQGRDDRQLIFLPPGSPASFPGVPLAEDAYRVFPNVPYEEKKGVRRA